MEHIDETDLEQTDEPVRQILPTCIKLAVRQKHKKECFACSIAWEYRLTSAVGAPNLRVATRAIGAQESYL